MPVYLHYWGALLRAGTGDPELRDKLIAFDRRFPEPPVFRLLLARLLAVSKDGGVGDPERALEMADALYAAQPIPPHTELLALALAASGNFDRAQELQQGLAETALMMGAFAEVARLEETAASYRDQRLPEPPWPLQDPMFTPPAVDPDLVMRNYPAGQPY